MGLTRSCSDVSAWKRLVDLPSTSDERISLITDIFLDRDVTEVAGLLHGEDVQSFVDAIDEVLSCHSIRFTGLDSPCSTKPPVY